LQATLEWFGTATWRLEVDDTVIWLDAYLDRAPTAQELRLTGATVDRAAWMLVGHSHFDHVAQASLMARNTGATVVGSALTSEIVEEDGVPATKTLTVKGGEVVQAGPVTIRVYPSLHGFNGLREWPDPQGRDRRARVAALRETAPDLAEAALSHLRDVPEKQMRDGGPLAYLLQWPGTTLFWHDTPGMVTPSWEAAADLRPDVAILAAAAAFSTPNVDDKPLDEGQHAFIAHSAGILRPKRVILNHHDDWCPPITFHLDEDTFRPGLEGRGIALEPHTVNQVFDLV
jgi:L-ascorbate metabolism protein UlaG (beta-lactamase superfamily)